MLNFFFLIPNNDWNTSGSTRQKYGRSAKEKKIHKVKESEVETAEGYDQVDAHHCKWSMYEFLYQSLYTIHLDPLSFCKAVINNIDTKDKTNA